MDKLAKYKEFCNITGDVYSEISGLPAHFIVSLNGIGVEWLMAVTEVERKCYGKDCFKYLLLKIHQQFLINRGIQFNRHMYRLSMVAYSSKGYGVSVN